MPYSIVTDHPECSGYAVIKDSNRELLGCHRTMNQANAQLTALNIAEYGQRVDPPAPEKDQISGSDKNEPGSASGKSGDVSLSAETEKALQNKAEEHNAAMSKADRPNWTRVRLGALKAVYRRGSGAYSTSHRPGISRPAWSMARVNAFLYLAKNGRPQNPKYTSDNDLLNADHPKYSGKRTEQRQDSYTPTAAMRSEAQRGLDWRSEFGRGGTEIGIARARDISNGKQLPLETVNRMVSFFARHEVDKQAEGFSPGEDGYPSNGRIAWALWGGDAGRSWAENIVAENRGDDEEDEYDYEDRALPDNYRPASSEDVPTGRNCGNCIFNLNLYCTKWQARIAANYYCNAWQPMETRKKKALDILEKLNSVRYNLTKS